MTFCQYIMYSVQKHVTKGQPNNRTNRTGPIEGAGLAALTGEDETLQCGTKTEDRQFYDHRTGDRPHQPPMARAVLDAWTGEVGRRRMEP